MEGLLPPPDHQLLVSSFLEIAAGQSADTARQFLNATDWKLDEALILFYGNEGGAVPPHWALPPSDDVGGDDVRPPSAVRRDTLYDNDVALYDEPPPMEGLWESSDSVKDISNDEDSNRSRGPNLAALYRPPYALMYSGTFQNSKDEAKKQNKWLMVNVQSTTEFASHVLNRDTWANESVARIIESNFVFWQYDNDTEEGRKVCTYYRLDSIPAVLVIDPITGRNMRSWNGVIQPQCLEDGLQLFLDQSPSEHLASQCNKRRAENETREEEAAMETEKKKEHDNVYPALPEEPLGDGNLVCRVGVRLPDGRRLQRNFLRSDPIQLLWSFCHSQVRETDQTKPFRLMQAVPGASEVLEYETNLSVEESGIANSMITVTWD